MGIRHFNGLEYSLCSIVLTDGMHAKVVDLNPVTVRYQLCFNTAAAAAGYRRSPASRTSTESVRQYPGSRWFITTFKYVVRRRCWVLLLLLRFCRYNGLWCSFSFGVASIEHVNNHANNLKWYFDHSPCHARRNSYESNATPRRRQFWLDQRHRPVCGWDGMGWDGVGWGGKEWVSWYSPPKFFTGPLTIANGDDGEAVLHGVSHCVRRWVFF